LEIYHTYENIADQKRFKGDLKNALIFYELGEQAIEKFQHLNQGQGLYFIGWIYK